jgi:hypothetical protein
MKNLKIFLAVLLMLPLMSMAQTKDKKAPKKDKPERAAFQDSWLIDNPTNVVYKKGTLKFDMQHRFGALNGKNDMVGFWAPANIRLGVSYSFLDYLTLGVGTTKDNRLVDFNAKVALLRQTRSDKIPVSVTYFGNAVIDSRSKDNFNLIQNRYSYFSQIIIARRFNSTLSLQVAPSYSHYNVVDAAMKNDEISISFGGRVKISPQTAIIAEYNQPLTDQGAMKAKAGLSGGVEFSTGSHAFQIFITNYKGIIPQKNYMFNQNSSALIGFNIMRTWNF